MKKNRGHVIEVTMYVGNQVMFMNQANAQQMGLRVDLIRLLGQQAGPYRGFFYILTET